MDIYLEKIVSEAQKRNIALTTLCQNAGVGKQTIANWKSGSVPSMDKVVKIIKYLEMSADEVFEIKPFQKTVLVTAEPDYIRIREKLKSAEKALNYGFNESDITEVRIYMNSALKFIEQAIDDINNKK